MLIDRYITRLKRVVISTERIRCICRATSAMRFVVIACTVSNILADAIPEGSLLTLPPTAHRAIV